MIRVLHIMGCSDAGGISSVVLNYYRHIDRTKIHFDIALTISTVGQNGKALQELGAKIHYLPLKSSGMKAFMAALETILKEEKYDALHVHESETCYIALMVAKKLGIPCRIAHSHSGSPWEGWKGELRRLSGVLLNYPVSTHVIGCGQLAGERVFGKWNMRRPKALVLPNAVDTKKFAYDEVIREETRKELGLEGKFVLGMVGRLCVEKNYPFALALIRELAKEHPECVLVIAGNGEEQHHIEMLIQEYGISAHVKLLGKRSDVHRLYQAFDVFLLTSVTEGFPVAAVEAMSSGLPVLLSDVITGELKFYSCVEYLPLTDIERWLDAIRCNKVDSGRKIRYHEPEKHGLSIADAAKRLELVYQNDLQSNMKRRIL